MTGLLALFVSVGLAWLILGSVYWQIVYPTLRKRVRFQLFRYRDALRRLALENKVDSASFAYRFAEQRLCILAGNLNVLTLLSFIRFSSEPDEVNIAELKQFYEEAPVEVQEIWKKAAAVAFNMIFINSPIIVLLMLSMTPIMMILKGARLLIKTSDNMLAFVAARGLATA